MGDDDIEFVDCPSLLWQSFSDVQVLLNMVKKRRDLLELENGVFEFVAFFGRHNRRVRALKIGIKAGIKTVSVEILVTVDNDIELFGPFLF